MKNTNSVAVFFGDAVSLREIRKLPYDVSDIILTQSAFRNIDSHDPVLSRFRVHTLESYVRPPNVQRAAELLVRLSQNALPDGTRLSHLVRYHDFEVWWLNQKLVYMRYLLPYLEYEAFFIFVRQYKHIYISGLFQHEDVLREVLRAYGVAFTFTHFASRFKQIRSRVHLAAFFMSFVQLFVSFISFLLLIFRRPQIGIWVGDKMTLPRDYDFRYEDLYRELRLSGLSFVEYLRAYTVPREFFKNMFTRRRPVVYYESILRPVWFLFAFWGRILERRIRRKVHVARSLDFFDRFLFFVGAKVYGDSLSQRALIPVCKLILKSLGTRVLFSPGSYSRSGSLVMAAKDSGIPVLGLQHGAFMSTYNPEESGLAFDGPRSYALDLLGVWSPFWKNYFLRNRNFFKDDNVVVMGHLRAFQPVVGPETYMAHSPLRVLLISEPLVHASEILPYLHEIFKDARFSLSIKCRPERNDTILKVLGKDVDRIPLYYGRMEEAFSSADVVIGSHSTALLEALYFYKPVVILNTVKWSDYFEVKKNGVAVFTQSPQDVTEALVLSTQVTIKELHDRRTFIWGDGTLCGPKNLMNVIESYLQTGILRCTFS